MHEILGKYTEIVVDILVLALLLTIVMGFSSMSRGVVGEKKQRDAVSRELKQYREIHNYINAETVKGDDIVRFVGMYRQEYDLEVVQDSMVYRLNTKESNPTRWDIESLVGFVGDKRESNYRVEVQAMSEEEMKVQKIRFVLQ